MGGSRGETQRAGVATNLPATDVRTEEHCGERGGISITD